MLKIKKPKQFKIFYFPNPNDPFMVSRSNKR